MVNKISQLFSPYSLASLVPLLGEPANMVFGSTAGNRTIDRYAASVYETSPIHVTHNGDELVNTRDYLRLTGTGNTTYLFSGKHYHSSNFNNVFLTADLPDTDIRISVIRSGYVHEFTTPILEMNDPQVLFSDPNRGIFLGAEFASESGQNVLARLRTHDGTGFMIGDIPRVTTTKLDDPDFLGYLYLLIQLVG